MRCFVVDFRSWMIFNRYRIQPSSFDEYLMAKENTYTPGKQY